MRHFSLARWIAMACAAWAAWFGVTALPVLAVAQNCTFSCTSGAFTQPYGYDPERCEETCRAACYSSCGAERGGCAQWRCAGGASEVANGDSCASDLFNHTTGDTDPLRASMASLAQSNSVATGRWLCRTPEDASDASSHCLSQDRCSGSTAKCCVPIDRRTCASASGVVGSAEYTNLASRSRTQPNDWSCQARSSMDARAISFRCLNAAAACNGRTGYSCCIPPEANIFDCSAGADANRITALRTQSGTTPDQWYCQDIRNSRGHNDRDLFCVDGSPSACGSSYHCCIPPAAQAAVRAARANPATSAATCAERARVANADTEQQIQGIIQRARQLGGTADAITPAQFTCLRACQAGDQTQFCVNGGCGDQEAQGVRCCLPTQYSHLPAPAANNTCPAGTAGAAQQPTQTNNPAASTARAGSGGGGFRIALPACVATGRCGINDIIQTGANFANFLFELSGAIFLAIFIYGGFLYLTALGDAKKAGSGKAMIVNAAIGMILVFGATTLVRFVYQWFTQPADQQQSLCLRRYGAAGYACVALPGDDAAEIERNATFYGCRPSSERACNLDGQDANIRCCPAGGGEQTQDEADSQSGSAGSGNQAPANAGGSGQTGSNPTPSPTP